MKITDKELTQAVKRYARRHVMFHRTVRTITSVRRAAVAEWLHARNDPRAVYWPLTENVTGA
jgi:hypothetical protein